MQQAQLRGVIGVGEGRRIDAQRLATGQLQGVDQPLQRGSRGVRLARRAVSARRLAVDQGQRRHLAPGRLQLRRHGMRDPAAERMADQVQRPCGWICSMACR
jgi:hypothetical protein